MSPVLVLVGPPGAGKSTVGALVAEGLGVTVRDTDADIERATGSTIAELFVEHGEAHFRALEKAAVAAALAEHDGVVVLGGGAILDAHTRELLRDERVVFLDVGVAHAARRIGLNRDRPLLLGNVRAQWIRLMRARRPLYLEVATATVDTDGTDPSTVAERVLRSLQVRQ